MTFWGRLACISVLFIEHNKWTLDYWCSRAQRNCCGISSLFKCLCCSLTETGGNLFLLKSISQHYGISINIQLVFYPVWRYHWSKLPWVNPSARVFFTYALLLFKVYTASVKVLHCFHVPCSSGIPITKAWKISWELACTYEPEKSYSFIPDQKQMKGKCKY